MVLLHLLLPAWRRDDARERTHGISDCAKYLVTTRIRQTKRGGGGGRDVPLNSLDLTDQASVHKTRRSGWTTLLLHAIYDL